MQQYEEQGADAVFLHCAHSATTAFVDALIEATTTTTQDSAAIYYVCTLEQKYQDLN